MTACDFLILQMAENFAFKCISNNNAPWAEAANKFNLIQKSAIIIFRRKARSRNHKIQHVISMIRFGGGNKVIDHTGAGGIAMGVTEEGNVFKFGYDKNNKLF